MADESLRVTEGMAAGTAIELGDEFVIGRAMVGEGRLGEDPELSRRHARIARRAGDQLTIEDLGSTNGTFLNGRPLDGTEVLRPGDTIKLGTTTLQVLDASGQAPQATAFRKVLEPKDQATVPRDVGPPAPAPQARPAPPPAAPRAPARPAPAAPPPRTGRPPGAGGRRPPVPLIAAGAALIAAVVLAVVLLSGGGSDEPKELSAAEIVEQNTPSTVSINTKGPGFDERREQGHRAGGGSGIVVDAQHGFVLTNAHVVAGATSVKALTDGGTEVNARRLGNAPCEDVAMIQLTPRPRGLKAATLGHSAGARGRRRGHRARISRRVRGGHHEAQAADDPGYDLVEARVRHARS